MRSNRNLLLAVVCLALASLACQAVTNLVSGGETPTEEQTVPAPQNGDVILEDDFSTTGWGTGTDADSSVEYANGALQFIINTKDWFVWSTPNGEDYENIHLEVTAINNDAAPAGGVLGPRRFVMFHLRFSSREDLQRLSGVERTGTGARVSAQIASPQRVRGNCRNVGGSSNAMGATDGPRMATAMECARGPCSTADEGRDRRRRGAGSPALSRCLGMRHGKTR